MEWIKIERPLFTLFVGVVFAGAIRVASEWSIRASIIILVLGTIGLALAATQLVLDLKNISAKNADKALTMEAPATGAESRWGNVEIWGWLLGFYAAIHIVGFLAAVPVFVFSYTKSYGGKWRVATLLAIASWGFVYMLFDFLLHVPWPTPLLSLLIP